MKGRSANVGMGKRVVLPRVPRVIPTDPLKLSCPFCGAKKGKDCATSGGGFSVVHVLRIKAAASLGLGRVAALRELTARNQLRFLRTEIAVARSSVEIALRHNVRLDQGFAECQIAIAKKAYTTAARFLRVARIEESVRMQFRRDLVEIRRAFQEKGMRLPRSRAQ